MTLASVVGQPRAIEALRGDPVHHAYLFAGPEGVGKQLVAVGLVQALACPVKPNDAGRVERGLVGRSDITGTPSRENKLLPTIHSRRCGKVYSR